MADVAGGAAGATGAAGAGMLGLQLQLVLVLPSLKLHGVILGRLAYAAAAAGIAAVAIVIVLVLFRSKLSFVTSVVQWLDGCHSRVGFLWFDGYRLE